MITGQVFAEAVTSQAGGPIRTIVVQGIPYAAGVACLGFAAVLALAGRMHWPKTTFGFAFAGSVLVVGSFVGRKINQGLNVLTGLGSDFAGRWVGVSAATLTGLAAALATFWVVLWLYHKDFSLRALAGVVIVPFLILLIPGQIGSIAAQAAAGIAWPFGYVAAAAFGL